MSTFIGARTKIVFNQSKFLSSNVRRRLISSVFKTTTTVPETIDFFGKFFSKNRLKTRQTFARRFFLRPFLVFGRFQRFLFSGKIQKSIHITTPCITWKTKNEIKNRKFTQKCNGIKTKKWKNRFGKNNQQHD